MSTGSLQWLRARAPEGLKCVQLGEKTDCGGKLNSSLPVPTSQVINKVILFMVCGGKRKDSGKKQKKKRFKTEL